MPSETCAGGAFLVSSCCRWFLGWWHHHPCLPPSSLAAPWDSPFLCLLMTLSWDLGSTLIHDLILKFLL